MKYFVNGNYLLFDYLRNNIDGKSKNNIKSLLKNKVVFVNGKIVTKYNYVLCDGDVVEINKKKANNNINIIYEDNDIIVIDKPSKILTISNKNEKVNTLYRMVSDYLKKEHKKVFIILILLVLLCLLKVKGYRSYIRIIGMIWLK